MDMNKIILALFLISTNAYSKSLDCEEFFILANFGQKQHLRSPDLNSNFFDRFANNYLESLNTYGIVLTKKEIEQLSKKIKKNSPKYAKNFKDLKCEVFNDIERDVLEKYKRFDSFQNMKYPKISSLNKIKINEEDFSKVEGIKKFVKKWTQNEKLINPSEPSKIVVNRIAEDRNEILLKNFYYTLDPHSGYIPEKESVLFNSDSTGERSGLGVEYVIDFKGIKVSKIIKDSALEDGPIKKDDYILKVNGKRITQLNQGDFAKQLSIPEGSEVNLQYLNEKNEIKEYKVKTKKFNSSMLKVSSKIIEKSGKNFLILKIPSFYYDPSKARGASNDMIEEYRKNKDKKIDAIILDLRSNPGGAVIEAINMVGYFSGRQIVLYTKDKNRTIPSISSQKEAEIKEPLFVMTNKFSASASEIVSGALKDLQRGVIIGDKTTFGKGTVQEVMNHFQSEELGIVKFTTSQFYRPNGHSTQIKGVESDIELPDFFESTKSSESLEKNPLTYDQIDPILPLDEENKLYIPYLNEKSKERVLKGKKEIESFKNKMTRVDPEEENSDISDNYPLNETINVALDYLDVAPLEKVISQTNSEETLKDASK